MPRLHVSSISPRETRKICPPHVRLTELRAMMPLQPATFEQSLRLAERQAEVLTKDLAAGAAIPAVSISVVTGRHRVRVEYPLDQRLPSAGFWDTGTRQWVIELPWDAAWPDKRYSLAREFKHILDYHQAGDLYRGDNLRSPASQADEAARRFADHLLVPTRLLRRALDTGADTIEELTAVFLVPTSVVLRRLSETGLDIVLRNKARTPDIGRRS
ncbi:ImmA/IrrE family metallo-endopeptidase [Nocardia cyriacigeorgica]|uniref:ImmA/IrrE family metallo-endopeptidase n=1 Tax=Nocardia cyriacigeorgica TaxID=135487 RepID=A0A5R8PCP5_9NOCA|nr:ImmA/IrrE family metallo-endopeptidase [Nocardia cyriacigeorgica]